MLYEDFQTFTLVDGYVPDRVTVESATKVSWVDLDRDVTAYLYKNYTAGYFGGDFAHQFEIQFSNMLTASLANHWMLANIIGDRRDIIGVSGDGISLFSYDLNENLYLSVIDGGAVTNDIWATPGPQPATTYFVTITRTDATDTYIAVIRIGSHVGAVQDTLTVIADAAYDFQYLYGCASDDMATGARDADGFTENLCLNAPCTFTTVAPTTLPTSLPPTTLAPTTLPTTAAPTSLPPTTLAPTTLPTTSPPTTLAPTTLEPTEPPTTSPVATTPPPTTLAPTTLPTTSPPTTLAPTTLEPTAPPTTLAPTTLPTTAAPTSLAPTTLPTTSAPTTIPTTSVPTTLAPTTVAPTTIAPTTVATTVVPTTTLTTLAPTTIATTLAPTTIAATTIAPTTLAPTVAPTTAAIAEVCVMELESEIVRVIELDSEITRVIELDSTICKR